MDIVIFLLIAFGISRIPVIGKYVKVVNTMIHESGHALMAMLTSGKVYSISLFANTEGVARTGSRFWVGRVLTSIAGYPFSSFVSFVLMYFLFHQKYEIICYALLGFVVINVLFWVRNIYGILWLLTFGAILGVIWYTGFTTWGVYLITLFVSIVFVEAIYTAFIILWLSIREKENAGDARNLSRSTFIPTVIWGLLFALQSLYFGYLGITHWF